jgi:superfamily II RNA helicase
VILSTPTGSGKSLVAIGAHAASLARGERTFYTAPIKALVSEKFFALIDVFGADKVGMLTGDAAVNETAPIICCTAEILANLALRSGARADVGTVVMDEFHYYADPDRGWAWQVPLIELPQAQFVLMSATLGDVTFFRDDLTRRTGRPTALVTSVERPVPLHYRYVLTPLHETITELLATHEAPVYVVHFTQASAVERAQALMSVNVTSREEKQAIADLIGNFRLPPASARRSRGWCATGSGCTTPGCCRGIDAWSKPSPRPACSRSSAGPIRSASASTCPSARCCSPH